MHQPSCLSGALVSAPPRWLRAVCGDRRPRKGSYEVCRPCAHGMPKSRQGKAKGTGTGRTTRATRVARHTCWRGRWIQSSRSGTAAPSAGASEHTSDECQARHGNEWTNRPRAGCIGKRDQCVAMPDESKCRTHIYEQPTTDHRNEGRLLKVSMPLTAVICP
jgi:hypothetical protein